MAGDAAHPYGAILGWHKPVRPHERAGPRSNVRPRRGRPRGTAPAASNRSSLLAGPINCMLAGNGPPVGTGSERAGTPARLTGRVQRETNRSSPSSRCGGKMLSVGVTRRSTSAKVRSSVSFQARWTRQARLDGALVEGAPELESAAHAVADPVRVLGHQRGVRLPGLDHQQEAGLQGGVVPAGDASSRQSHPTRPRARSSAAVMAGSASMGSRPTTRSSSS